MKSTKEEAEVCMKKSKRSVPPTYAPSLVFLHGKRYRDQTFCTLSDGRFHVRSIPQLRGMYIVTLSHGWLMLQSICSAECCLFNPVSLTKMVLPPLIHSTFSLGVLTTSPSDPNCIVVLVSNARKSYCFCSIKDDNWIEQKLLRTKKNDPVLIGGQIHVICCKGKIYLFFFQGMAVIDVQNTFRSIKFYATDCKLSLTWATRWTTSMVESCGEIFKVVGLKLGYLCNVIQTFDVFKLDLSTMEWVKVETLGDRVFLLGTTSMSVSATESGLKADCIYFSHPGYTTLCRFDMHDGTIMNLPCPTKFPYWEGPFWVVPNLKLQMQKQMVKMEESSHPRNQDWMSWNDLPTELFELILSFIFLGDCIRFRLTRKSWLSITPPLRSNCLLNKFLSEPQQLPWLMSFPKNDKGVCNLYHSIYSDAYTMNVPELAGAVICSAKYGWLLMSQGKASFFFFNPLTREIIKLPYVKPLHLAGISFSSAPTSSDFVVIAYVATIMLVYRKGMESWSYHFIIDDGWEFSQSLCNPVFHDGVFYCLSKNGKLGLFDPREMSQSQWRVYSESAVFSHSLNSTYMQSIRSFIVEYNGEIFSVFMGLQGKPILVYKLDLSKMEWTEVDSLGNKVLFLSHTASILIPVPAGSKGIENRIYIPRFHGNDTLFYSMATGNYHCFGSKYSCEDWVDSWKHSQSTWVQPTK